MNKDEAKQALMSEARAASALPHRAGPEDAQQVYQQAKPNHALDDLADALLLRIARAFGECVAQPDFCGFAIDETRDDSGRLLALALIPCDRDETDAPQRRLARGALALAKAH